MFPCNGYTYNEKPQMGLFSKERTDFCDDQRRRVLQKYALALFGFQRRRAVVNTTSIFKHTALRTQISRYEKIKILEGVVIILNALNKRRGRNIGCRIKGRQRQWAVRNSQPVITTKDKQLVMMLGKQIKLLFP